MILPVIMAGGSGTRLWPLSRSQYPKQFLRLAGEHTMLQQTVLRLKDLPVSEPLTITNENHRFLVAEQLLEINQLGPIILEPAGRNTAPAIALAAEHASDEGDDPLLLVLAADHVIGDVAAFTDTIKKAIPLAEQGKLVTFGVVATEPHNGYGYIKAGDEEGAGFEVAEFVEKPDLEKAKAYLEDGSYFWNSGMFLFKASRYLEELMSHRPDIGAAVKRSMGNLSSDLDFTRIDNAAFEACPSESIDYAVMEKTDHAVVVPMDAAWSDIGSWSALWDVDEKCGNGNATRGETILKDTKNCLVHGGERLIATVGVEDLVIVDTKDALLVAAKDRVQEVKKVVDELKAQDSPKVRLHREVYRPWGHYDSIGSGERYQVKSIVVKPGAKLSVQKHNHRTCFALVLHM